jgi:hypothetical protein
MVNIAVVNRSQYGVENVHKKMSGKYTSIKKNQATFGREEKTKLLMKRKLNRLVVFY